MPILVRWQGNQFNLLEEYAINPINTAKRCNVITHHQTSFPVNQHFLFHCRLGFLWKYGGLYLDQDILVVNNLLHDRETNIDGSSKIENVKNTITRKLGDNFIAFQSLNISHLLPNDPTVGEVQDLYVEDMDPTTAQGSHKEMRSLFVVKVKNILDDYQQ